MNDCDLNAMKELQRCSWIYASLIGEKCVRIRLETGTEEGLGIGHPNLGKWMYYVDIGSTSFAGTVTSCLFKIRELISKQIGPGYL